MRKREKSEFLIEPTYAFGRMGCPPRVPGDAQILASVELRDFAQEAEAEALLAMEPEERAKEKTFKKIEEVARKEYLEGNEMWKKEEFKLGAQR